MFSSGVDAGGRWGSVGVSSTKENWQADGREVEAIVACRHADAFAFLGLHEIGADWVLRAFVPHADTLNAYTLDGKPLGHMIPRHAAGFFEAKVALDQRQPIRYEAKNAGGSWTVFDP